MSAAERTLLRGATIVAVDPNYPSEFVGDILIEGQVIKEIAPRIEVDPGAVRVVELEGRIITPGFVDTHRHIWQTPFRYAGADWTIVQYAVAMWGMAGPIYTPEDQYAALRLGLADALNAGVTQVYDWNHNVNTPDHADETVRAHRDSGARVVFGYGQGSPDWATFLDPEVGVSTPPPSDDIERILNQYYSSADQLTTLGLAARGPEVSPIEVVQLETAQARRLGLRQSIHIGNGSWAHIRPVRMMQNLGLLGEDITWIHGNGLYDEDLQLIADSGGKASCAPELESHMAHGPVAIRRFLDRGVRPSLSVDTCTNVSGDMFAIMRAALAMTRADYQNAEIAEGRDPSSAALKTSDVIEFATLRGAESNGLDQITGTLTPGKQADLVVIDTNAPNLLPLNYAAGAVVMGAHPGNVEHVLVAGRFVKRDFELVGIDGAWLRREADAVRDRLFERVGATRGGWIPGLGDADVSR
ncbi:MAG: 5-methylthioadenosine deaminase [Candidatus Leucobacter sulfamidivorax]|nr:5-methylthioadenosine deaminase [Candidatus Leucobacter sulfamidivorax]